MVVRIATTVSPLLLIHSCRGRQFRRAYLLLFAFLEAVAVGPVFDVGEVFAFLSLIPVFPACSVFIFYSTAFAAIPCERGVELCDICGTFRTLCKGLECDCERG